MGEFTNGRGLLRAESEVAGVNQRFSKCRGGGLSLDCYNPLKQIMLNLAIAHLYIISVSEPRGQGLT